MRYLLAFFFVLCADGQTAGLAISAVSLNIDPTSTDSYTMQGTFSNLDFSNAQSVSLQVGPFFASIPASAFTQSAGVWSYQDATGQTPYWISSLAIDTNAGAFTAQATGVVLAGIENPFQVQLGTDTAAACSMARVQQTGAGAFQLSTGDGANEPCQIAQVTTNTPGIPVGVSSNVVFTMNVFEGASFDATTLQIFRADGNAQPVGAPLCQPTDNGDGTYGCTVTFNESSVATIPLLAQASAGNQTILSPGFSVQVVSPFSADDEQEVASIQSAMTQAQQNWVEYGDSAYARILTIQALRMLMQPEAGLTGQPVELCPDGLSIGVRTASGLTLMLLLNDLADVVGPQQAGSDVLRPRTPKTRRLPGHNGPALARTRAVMPRAVNSDGSPAMMCNSPQRDIVQNTDVLIWDPGNLFFGSLDGAPGIVQKIGEAKCPPLNIKSLPGAQADLASIGSFENYGTIVLDSHGGVDPNHRGAVMTGQAVSTGLQAFFSDNQFSPTADVAVICTFYAAVRAPVIGFAYTNFGCFLSAYASYIARYTAGLGESIVFGGICDGAVGNLDIAQAFTPPGSKNAYYGFGGLTNSYDVRVQGAAIFDKLIHQHTNAEGALQGAPVPRASPLYFFGDPNLAYLGNPKLFSPQSSGPEVSFALGPGESLNLQAQLDGASACDGIINFHWINTAYAGHLTPSDKSGGQDDFTSDISLTTYKAFANAMGVDSVVVDFLPDVNDPPAARACTSGDINTKQILHFEFQAHGEWSEDYNTNGSSETAELDWDAAWDIPMASTSLVFPVNSFFAPALPGTTVTGTTTSEGGPNAACVGPPVINTNHGNGPTPLPTTPYLGAGPYNFATSILSMWVETFGGDDYHLCDGGLPTVGNYGPVENDYPTWDTPAGYMKFDLDLSQWLNKPDHSVTMKLPDLSMDTEPGGFGTGSTEVTNATMTITSRTVVTPAAAPSSMERAAH